MKKVFSIFFINILLVNSINLTLSAHYCGGNLAAFKFVFGNEKLSCGMEGGADLCSNAHVVVKKQCCEDKIQSFVIKDNFLSTTCGANAAYMYCIATVFISFISVKLLSVHETTVFEIPPDIVSVYLPFIQVFRI